MNLFLWYAIKRDLTLYYSCLLWFIKISNCIMFPQWYKCIKHFYLQSTSMSTTDWLPPQWNPLFSIINILNLYSSRLCVLYISLIYWPNKILVKLVIKVYETKHKVKANSSNLKKTQFEIKRIRLNWNTKYEIFYSRKLN